MKLHAGLLTGLWILLVFFLFFGLWKAVQNPNGDFANYYTASTLAAEHNFSNVHFYEHLFFQKEIEKYFLGTLGSFIPFPPATVLPLLPLTYFPPHAAKIFFTVVNIALLLWGIHLLDKITGLGFPFITLMVLLNGISLWNQFQQGQLYILLFFLIILSLYLHEKGKDFLAGAAMGLFLPIKYIPVLFIAYFALEKNIRFLIGSVLSCRRSVIRWSLLHQYRFQPVLLLQIFPSHLAGQIQDPYLAIFQSYNSLFNRLFVYDPSLNQSPFFASDALRFFFKTLLAVTMAVTTVFAIRIFPAKDAKTKTVYATALLLLFALVNSPASATYHFVLTIIPVIFLISLEQEGQYSGVLLFSIIDERIYKSKKIVPIVLLYGAINIIPFQILFTFDGRGLLTIFAYLKLFLLTAFFLLSLPRDIFMNRTFRRMMLASVIVVIGLTAVQKKPPTDGAASGAGYPGLIIKELSAQNDSLFYVRETRTGYIRCVNGEQTNAAPLPRRTIS